MRRLETIRISSRIEASKREKRRFNHETPSSFMCLYKADTKKLFRRELVMRGRQMASIQVLCNCGVFVPPGIHSSPVESEREPTCDVRLRRYDGELLRKVEIEFFSAPLA